MEKLQEIAKNALDSLARMEEIARSGEIKYNWDKACKEGTQLLHNTINNQREQLTQPPFKNLWEYVKYNYRSDYHFTQNLYHPDEEILNKYPDLKEEWEKCRATLDKLPEELPDSIEEFKALNLTEEDLDHLSISIWSFYEDSEDGEAAFDFSDDGTDEMEQGLESVKELLQIFLPKYEKFFRRNLKTDENGKIIDCLDFVALMTIGYETGILRYLQPEFNSLHFNFWGLREIKVLLERIAQEEYNSDLVTLLLQYVIEDCSLGDIKVEFKY